MPVRVWRVLDRIGDHGMCWAAATGVMVTRKGPSRRAAVRGATAAVATTVVVHAVAKPLLPRVHPSAHRFPSAHAASAAAFTVGAGLESTWRGSALAPVAVAVTAARVALGERRTGEVLAGSALGVGLALLTRRWWPVHDLAPARARPAFAAPALGDGEGLLVVANDAAGSGAVDERPDVATVVREALPAARILVPVPGTDLIAAVEQALGAADGQVHALGVAGGDGSVAAVAGIAARHGLPLVPAPAGTLNHFARDVGLDAPGEALEAAAEGSAVLVDLAEVTADGRRIPFVNTASLGGYPDMVQQRERWEGRIGKWPAAAVALAQVLYSAAPLHVTLDGRPATVWLLFVGNGIYHPRGMAPLYRPQLDGRRLDVRYLRADLPLSRTRFLLAVLSGTLLRSRVYVQRRARTADVHIVGDPIAIATDGEVWEPATRFRFALAPAPLTVYRPWTEHTAEGRD